MANALDIQVGGSHYAKTEYQPVQFYNDINASFFQGTIIKYIVRYREKGKEEDLKKAAHYAELAIQIKHKSGFPIDDNEYNSRNQAIDKFAAINDLRYSQVNIIRSVLEDNYYLTHEHIKQLLLREYPIPSATRTLDLNNPNE